MSDPLAEIDRAAAENPARQCRPWTADERKIALYRPGEIKEKTRLAILNNANAAAGRGPRTMAALHQFILYNTTPNKTEGNAT
jgi:hypothetical protein